jgi:amphi-Trp domain-containing protein
MPAARTGGDAERAGRVRRDERTDMSDLEIKRKLRLTRQEAGEHLIALGTALAGGSKSRLDGEGGSISFTVADEVEWEFEFEIDGDERELEIELNWSTATAPSAALPAAQTPAAAERRAPAKRAKATKRTKAAKSAKSTGRRRRS